MKKYLFIFLTLSVSAAYGQSINKQWQQDLNQQLEQFKACKTSGDPDISTCINLIGETLKTVYEVNDFYSKDLQRYMSSNEISSYLKSSKQWTHIGWGYEQEALNEAQKLANAKMAVVAIYTDKDGDGHMSVITPGELKLSGTWGFKVPNSTSFFLNSPQKSYVSESLSYAFSKHLIKQVALYKRNY